MKLTKFWTQVDGDVSPEKYGGTFARLYDDRIELIKVQPTREYVGDKDASEVGYPFWSREASFWPGDLDPTTDENRKALEYIGYTATDDEQIDPILMACARLDYGLGEEGPSGWSDAFQAFPRRIRRLLAAEDRDFRAMVKERQS